MMIPEADMGAISPQTSKVSKRNKKYNVFYKIVKRTSYLIFLYLLFQQYQHLQQFWFEIAAETKNETNFKSYQLPLARIKKIMKADKDVKVNNQTMSFIYFIFCEI